jgi:two-component system, cell cycle sensor histidine kinase and response regulator CckA
MCPRKRDNPSLSRTGSGLPTLDASILLQALSMNPAAVAITRFSDGLLLEMNEASLQLLGIHREDAIGRSTMDLHLWPTVEARSRFLDEIQAEGSIRNREITLQKSSGQSFTALMSARLMPVEGDDLLVISVLDITDRKRTEERRERDLQVNELLRHALIEIDRSSNLDEALLHLLTQVIKISQMDSGVVYRVEGESAVLRHHLKIPQELIAKISERPITAGYMKFALEHPEVVFDVLERFPEQNLLGSTFGIKHVYCFALALDGHPYAFLNVSSYADAPPQGKATVGLIQILVNETASAFRRFAIQGQLEQLSDRLRESLFEYSDLVNRIPIGVYKFRARPDGSYQFDYVSPRWCELCDVSEYDALSDVRNVFRSIYSEDLTVLTSTIEKSRLSFCPFVWEGRKKCRNGETRWFHAESRPALLENGDIRWDGIVYDVTVREQAEEALRESERKFRAYYEQAPLGIAVVDSWTGQFVQVNPAYCRITGFGQDELLHTSFQKITHPDDVGNDIEQIRSLRESETGSVQLQKRYIRPDGSTIWANLMIVPLWESGSNPTFHLTMAEDITEQKKAEEALKKSNQHFLTMTRCIPDTLWATDLTGRFTYISPNVERTHGYTPKEVLNRPFNKGVTPRQALTTDLLRDHELQMASLPEYDRNRIVTYESEERRKDGSIFSAEVTASIIWAEDGKPAGITGITRDITDRKRREEDHKNLESQLRQAQKMESIGRLAGGVAHDFNNMLGVILGHAEMAIEQIDPEHPLHENLKEIQNAANRSADLTRQLLAFARKQAIQPRIIDLNEIIAATLKMIQRLIGENIRLEWKPAGTLWPVKMDPSQIDQILANLCVNSRDAISGNGNITIKTANFVLRTENYRGNDGCVPGEYVQISVKDNGRGMDEATLGNIFEPFFTTKQVGEGTGLGLATVYGIVRQNDGFVHVESKPGEGTILEVYLPRHVASKDATERLESEAATRGNETVLLVEDEPTVLKVAMTMLKKLGYAVLPAHSPGEALRLAENYSKEITIVITDIIMPEMNGSELARKLQSLYPHLKYVFMSGWTADAMVDQGMLDPQTNFLQKPFSIKELAGALLKARQKD